MSTLLDVNAITGGPFQLAGASLQERTKLAYDSLPSPHYILLSVSCFCFGDQEQDSIHEVTAFLPRADEEVAFLMHCLPNSLREILFIVFLLHETSNPNFRNIWNMRSIKQLHGAEEAIYSRSDNNNR
jgi:hypothetical protein